MKLQFKNAIWLLLFLTIGACEHRDSSSNQPHDSRNVVGQTIKSAKELSEDLVSMSGQSKNQILQAILAGAGPNITTLSFESLIQDLDALISINCENICEIKSKPGDL